MIDHQSFTRWLERYGAAWQEGDPQQAMALFTEDATYHETPFSPPLVGREAIGRYWQEGAQQSQTNVSFQFQVLAVKGNEGLAHWHAAFERRPVGSHVQLDGILNATFDEEGRCRRFQEWWHREEKAA